MNKSATVRTKEINVCGWQAVSTLFAQHPDEIRRVFFDGPTGKRAGELCTWLAQNKRVYRQLELAELAKAAGTVHHGGIVAVIAERPLRRVSRETIGAWAKVRAPILLLDRVSNAHNLGAIARTAAFFGVRNIILPDSPAQALPGDAAFRVAEGGMEFVDFYRVISLPEFCNDLKRHYTLIGTSLRGNQLSPSEAKDRGLSRPPAIILGNEEKGLAPNVAALCDRLVKIPGAETVESLNVSAATAVLCWEFFARR